MLDIKAIRDDPEPFRKGLARRNLADAVDVLLAADERRRALTARVEELRAEQNRASKAIGGAQGEEKQRLIDEVSKVSARAQGVGARARRGRGRAHRPAREDAERPARELARRLHR